MVTSVHITRIVEKTSANDLGYEVDTFKNDTYDVSDCPDYYPSQSLSSSWDSFLTGQQRDNEGYCNKNNRKYPIRVFAIQPEA
jgi:hypothetical protein